MSIIQGTAKSGGTVAASFYDYPIEQSLRFDGSSYLSKTFNNNGQSNWSISLWIKRSTLQSVSEVILTARSANTPYTLFVFLDNTFTSNLFFADNSITVEHYFQGRYRDLSSWYHIVLVSEPSNSTVSERLRVYVNGVRKIKVGGYDPSSSSSNWNKSGSTHTFGQAVYSTANPFNGYMANIQFIDGQALDPYFFGETKDNIWVPYNAFSTAGSGTATASDGDTATDSYGTNGFHLTFEDGIESLPVGGYTGNQNAFRDKSHNTNHWKTN